MAVSMAYLKTLSAAINKISGAGQSVIEAQLNRLIQSGNYTDPTELVSDALEALEPVFEAVSEQSASISATSYDALRTVASGEAMGAQAYPSRSADWTKDALYAIAAQSSGDMGRFITGVKGRLDYEAKRAAGETMFQNGDNDRQKPRFARIPTGPETCTFCLMLASRGFVYHSEESAGSLGHYHAHCSCRIVPQFGGESYGGYDPDEYYRLWQEALNGGAKHLESEPAYKIDRTLPVYQKLTKEQMDRIDAILASAPEKAARLYKRYESDFALTSDGSKAYFDPKDVRVRLDVDVVLGDKGSGPKVKGDTWFHEFGHSIDYMSTGTDDLYAKLGRMTRDRKSGHGHSSMYASVAYKDNLFGKTLQKEVSARVKTQWDKLKDEKRDLISLFDTLDFDTMHMRGYITVRERDRLKQMLRTSREFAEIRGTDPRDELMATSTVKNLIDGYAKKERAYKRLSEEIFYLPHAHNGAISDIFEGVTKCKVRDFWGHGKTYWKDQQNVPIEAFAEFYSAEMVDPDAVSLIEVYFPESKKVFDDLVEALAEGG